MTTFLTSQDIEHLINVDRSTVYRMAEDGRLPGVKVGRQWRFPADRVHEQLGLDPSRTSTTPRSTPRPRSTPTEIADRPLHGATDLPALAELLLPEVVQSVADLVADLFGVMVVITDMDGRPITTVANPCGYYTAISDQPGAVKACLRQWRLFADEPHVVPRFVRTHLGFLCARTFVWVDLKPVGMIVVGGVTPPIWPPLDAEIEAIADEIGVPHRRLLDTVEETWHLDIVEQRRIVRLLPQIGDLLSQLASARGQVLTRTPEPTPQGEEQT